MHPNAFVAALNTLAEQSGARYRYVTWCTCCVNDLDPNWELPARVASDRSQCFACGNPEREKEGMCLVLLPDSHPAVCQRVST